MRLEPCGALFVTCTPHYPFAQANQVSRNVTTNELANWRRYKYLQTVNGQFKNPFDHGWKRNLQEAFRPETTPCAPYYLPPSQDEHGHKHANGGGCCHKH